MQLLAQTCSQIGADTGSNKLLSEKSGEATKAKGRSPTLVVSDGSTSVAAALGPASKPVSFKPYEHGAAKAKEGNNKKQKQHGADDREFVNIEQLGGGGSSTAGHVHVA